MQRLEISVAVISNDIALMTRHREVLNYTYDVNACAHARARVWKKHLQREREPSVKSNLNIQWLRHLVLFVTYQLLSAILVLKERQNFIWRETVRIISFCGCCHIDKSRTQKDTLFWRVSDVLNCNQSNLRLLTSDIWQFCFQDVQNCQDFSNISLICKHIFG
jgi:hypothetical protein